MKSNKLEYYEDTIIKVVVTYNNNDTKEFLPHEWYLFEEGVSKIAKHINIIYIQTNGGKQKK